MKKIVLSIVTAAAVGAAGFVATPQPAQAAAWWVVPAIVGAGVIGVGAGAIAATNPPVYAYEPAPARNIYVQPTACHVERQIVNGRWRRVQVCD